MNALTEEQWETLGRYRFHPSTAANQGVDASTFCDVDEMRNYLSRLRSMIGTDDLKVAASIFMKRYAFVAAMGLVAMTYWNKKVNVTPENLILVDEDKNGLWMPHFHLKDASVSEFLSLEEKNVFIQSLFREHLDRVIQSLKKTTKLSNLILWENVAVYVFWIFENDDFLQNEGWKSRRDDQFRALLSNENRQWFGRYHQNPLARYYSRKVNVDDGEEKVRVRKTCCFSYRMENGEQYRCKTCPRTCLVKKP